MLKKNVCLIFGGYSAEHEVSKVSAATVISNLSEEKHNVIPVYITREGKWLLYDGNIDNFRNIQWEKFGTPCALSPDRTNKGLLRIVGDKVKNIPIDVVFPVLHGTNGEDGTIQGLFEMSGIPYVGCGVLASSVSMDKAFTKLVAKQYGIAQTPYAVFNDYECDIDYVSKKIGRKIGYPCFVKPANAGSSVGISKVKNKKELADALELATSHDRRIIIEKAVSGRELECGVLGAGQDVRASAVGEILPGAEFYDYEAKYKNNASKTVVPADIPEAVSDEIRELAIAMFRAVDGMGLARVDFFLEDGTNKVIFNEINTMPGFTSISMYPMLWSESGLPLPELLDMLVELSEVR